MKSQLALLSLLSVLLMVTARLPMREWPPAISAVNLYYKGVESSYDGSYATTGTIKFLTVEDDSSDDYYAKQHINTVSRIGDSMFVEDHYEYFSDSLWVEVLVDSTGCTTTTTDVEDVDYPECSGWTQYGRKWVQSCKVEDTDATFTETTVITLDQDDLVAQIAVNTTSESALSSFYIITTTKHVGTDPTPEEFVPASSECPEDDE